MSVASIPYVLFVVVMAPVYGLSPRRVRNYLLLAASFVFYGSFNWAFLFLLVAVIGASYAAGLTVHRWPQARWQLPLWIGVIIAPLLFYKYVLVWAQALQEYAIPVSTLDFGGWGSVLIPLGLSFFTFQSLGYVLDVSRKAVAPERDFVLFSLFIAFFPQLLAGPIERFSQLASQLREAPRPTAEMVLDGLLLLSFGLFLKTCLGDRIATYVDAVYAAPLENGSATVLFGMYGFTLQLYGDFFGYSMIALGSARLFGIRLTPNFRQPFFARDIPEFWQRWHITLTRWIGDYVYRPLAVWSIRRKGLPPRIQEAITLLVTWVTLGLWHGAGWNFLVFGAAQAGLVMAHNTLTRAIPKSWRRGKESRTHAIIATVVTFHLVVLTFALIRAPSLGEYWDLLRALTAFSPGVLVSFEVMVYGAAALAIVAVADTVARFKPGFDAWRGVIPRTVITGALLILVVTIGNDDGRAFIYFRF
jgi:D-alanyl-lipoteichoic acid acyltransferase DltB (MBOAT superfamily)